MEKKAYYQLVMVLFFIPVFWGLLPTAGHAKEKVPADWSFLSTEKIGAKRFIQSHPNYDGRGVVIFILDSGVDMGVAGLQQTSDGSEKVIDVRDFSGQGEVMLYAGNPGEEGTEKFIRHPDGFRLYNYQNLTPKPVQDKYLIGYLDESWFINSDVKDLNNNGKYDDKFGVLVFEVSANDTRYWLAYVDTDGDGHIDDEKPLRNYRIKYDTFRLRGGDSRYDRATMTFALNILPDQMKVSFHFDDTGHGTHVAGIAAGFGINGQNGFNGIAPGAQIISLKIGKGIYEGGCTVTGSLRKALNFVEDYARSCKKPVVVNISYGIGSTREGRSDIEHIVNDVLQENENIFICLSNGNEGPGISTTGTPAAATQAFSVGAMLPAKLANQSLGTNLKQDKIYYFSSRGGELAKPDAVAPGFASSTVPSYSDDDFMRGTSMAAPQASGAAALLLSAAQQWRSPMKTSNLLIHRALKYSAVPIPGYSYLDQGHGVINVPAAFEFLKSYSEKHANDRVLVYEISANSPWQTSIAVPSAYWRTGGYFPGEDENQTFVIQPMFNETIDALSRANFYRAFELKSTDPWLIPVKKICYLKGEMPVEVAVKYDSRRLTRPGIYSGKVIGYRKQSGSRKYDPENIEFELLNTVIVPYIFDYHNKYQQRFQRRSIAPGDVDRYFVLVPVGATAAKVTLAPTVNSFCQVTAFGYDPNGIRHFSFPVITSREQNDEVRTIAKSELIPGIWEIDVYAEVSVRKTSHYDLSISFSSFKVEPPLISDFSYNVGSQPGGTLRITNQFNVPFYGFGRGKLSGYQREQSRVVRNQDVFNYDFQVDPGVDRVDFEIDFDDDSFLQFTDVAINVYDTRGRAIFKDAMNSEETTVILDRISEGEYSLEIVVAFAYSSYDAHWKFRLTEKYYTSETIGVKIYQGVDRLFKLFPFVTREFQFTLSDSPRIPPDGFHNFGTIEFIDRNLLQEVFIVPVTF